jgi:hypothetical protein
VSSLTLKANNLAPVIVQTKPKITMETIFFSA